MDVGFRSRKMEKIFNSDSKLVRSYGKQLAKAIRSRTYSLLKASSLADLQADPRYRMHPLVGKRKGQYAIDLSKNFRLVFEPNHDPVPQKEDGGTDLTQVIAVTILEVVDYH